MNTGRWKKKSSRKGCNQRNKGFLSATCQCQSPFFQGCQFGTILGAKWTFLLHRNLSLALNNDTNCQPFSFFLLLLHLPSFFPSFSSSKEGKSVRTEDCSFKDREEEMRSYSLVKMTQLCIKYIAGI